MAAAADKARFFLEQSVPELKEYEKKKIFGKVWQMLASLGVSGEELIFLLHRMKSLRLSRNDQISNTNLMLEVHARSILCGMRSTK